MSNFADAQIHATTSGTTSSTTNGLHSLSELSPGLSITAGTITGNGPASGRTLDSSQATAFVQAWLPDSVFGSPPFQNPPSQLPVYDVELQWKYEGTVGSMTVYYASDGTSAWVSMPPQTLWPGVVVTQQRWIQAPNRTVAAFEGHLTPVPVPKGRTVTATAPQSSLSTAWILAIAGVVVVGAGIGIAVIRKRGAARSKP